MYNFKKIVLGVAPIRRDLFPVKPAVENKKRMMARLDSIFRGIHDLEIVNIDTLLKDGLLVEESDVKKVARYFREKEVDALFIPHTNFGQEESAAKLAKLLDVPVLLWGPRDGSPNDDAHLRDCDTQCGMFATSRALVRYGVEFTYVENCWLDSPIIEKEIERFVRVASVVKAFRNMRVLQLSTRPRQFLSVIVNEGELMEKYGVEVVPIESSEVLFTIDNIIENKKDEIEKLIAEWELKVDLSKEQCKVIKILENEKTEDIFAVTGKDKLTSTEEKKTVLAAIELGIKSLAEKHNCNTVASDCWYMFRQHYEASACFVFADLTDRGLSVCCENDINGSITSALVQAGTRGETSPFFADITVRHPQNDNAELMWHCGPFPPSLAKGLGKPSVLDCHGQYELKQGDITFLRFDGSRGKYVLFSDTAKSVDGPSTWGTYVWVETNNWPKWEKKLMYGPYIHHIVGAYCDLKEVFREASKYMGVEFDCVD